ncbi:MAG: hypothetical protein JW783_00445 [Bacteroidales bacterium]|nr:hypothetical protein [Bacteroidales bacterium]MBN2748490.1 hypothetical protein [Bacteroidales bacterium]
MAHSNEFLKIEFEDNGQDFLTWTIDAEGYVVRSEPFQQEVWVGVWVDIFELAIGLRPEVRIPAHGDEITVLNHRVINIETIKQ